jgi:nicotinamidase-related amidase
MRRLLPSQTAVLVIDVQERLAGAMPAAQMAELTRATTVLVEAAKVLGAAAIYTEQYPAGLGHTIAPVAEVLGRTGARRVEKVDFSACDEPAFAKAWAELQKPVAVVTGMETHVCVFQTVRELAARGVEVYVPLDGVASRRDDHRATGLELCRAAGATITTMETIVFDWLRRAGTPEFKQLSKLIR